MEDQPAPVFGCNPLKSFGLLNKKKYLFKCSLENFVPKHESFKKFSVLEKT